jgi:hypothetical protein
MIRSLLILVGLSLSACGLWDDLTKPKPQPCEDCCVAGVAGIVTELSCHVTYEDGGARPGVEVRCSEQEDAFTVSNAEGVVVVSILRDGCSSTSPSKCGAVVLDVDGGALSVHDPINGHLANAIDSSRLTTSNCLFVTP